MWKQNIVRKYVAGWLAGLGLLTVIGFAAQAQDDAVPWLILWNFQEKTGSVLAMSDDDQDGAYTLTVPVVAGDYSYRVAIGPNKKPIYGAGGQEGGQAIKFAIDGNRKVEFTYHADTHVISAEIGEPFIPPRQVVLVGNLQDELGHANGPYGGEWDPAATTTQMRSDDAELYTFTGTLPAGAYEYKVAIGGSWQENYGLDGKQDGANIPLTLEQEQEVTFYYNDVAHTITDSTRYTRPPADQMPRVVGDVPLAADDAVLRDADFDGVYTISLTLPAGAYTYRIAAGPAETDPQTLTLEQDREVTMFYDSATSEVVVDDGSVANASVYHDTYDRAYRDPFEAIVTGQAITLRIHARASDLHAARLLTARADVQQGRRIYAPAGAGAALAFVETRSLPAVGDVDVWSVTLTFEEPGLYGYKFLLNGSKEYGDDAQSGGTGVARLQGTDYFPLTVADADFVTPDWLKTGIMYQIFPDRFFNGDAANDTAKRQARGDEPLALRDWDDVPSAPPLGNDDDAFWNNDFFGGDLEGIRQKLEYLRELGVTVLYLNPIFSAASNHKYDAADYDRIDPMFGTLEEFQLLAQEARQRGMRLLLDGVFNHVGDDSVYFDRYGKYPSVGAYEYWSRVYDAVNTNMLRLEDAKAQARQDLLAEGQRFSPYEWHAWFEVRNRPVNGRYDYAGWSGYDSLPAFLEPSGPVVPHASELNNRAWADYMLYDEYSVAKRWLRLGASGWRLDVAPEVDAAFWREFRREVKQVELPSGESPVILGETWQDAAHFFLGDQFDSVMNYGFRHAVLNEFLLNGDAAAADQVLRSMRQQYPSEAFYALMNLIGSHDTARALYLLGGGDDAQVIAEAGGNFDYALGKQRLKLAALFQFGYPGVPAIYYGDEAGLTGARDPDCRRPYPWGREDADLLAYYRRLSALRAARLDLFARGDLVTLYADGDVYVFARQQGDAYAIVALNRGEAVQARAIPVKNRIPAVSEFVDQLDTDYATRIAEGELFVNLPPLSGRLLLSP